MLVLLSHVALAGSGPWVPGSGRTNLYLGLDGQRLTILRTANDGIEDIEVGEGISTVGAVLDLSYGIASRAELEVILPVQRSYANRPDAPLCDALGLDACATTTSVGVIEVRGKGLIADQVAGAPLSLSLGGTVRYGGLTSATRARLTNAGEGTLDLGPQVSIGRGGAFAKGYYSANLDLAWLYRLPNTTSYPNFTGDRAAPGSELFGAAELLVTPIASVSIGPSVGASSRPAGEDFRDLDLTDPDRFAALRYVQVRAGGKLVVRDGLDHALVLGIFRTIYAYNNPADIFSVSVGVSFYGLGRKAD